MMVRSQWPVSALRYSGQLPDRHAFQSFIFFGFLVAGEEIESEQSLSSFVPTFVDFALPFSRSVWYVYRVELLSADRSLPTMFPLRL
jgi:hypothetical protein